MDLTAQLQECFGKLGYFGPIPTSLVSNPSTIFIWQQLLNNVKPKDEVDKCRKTIIINRLLNKNKLKDSIQYPIPEIEDYNKLQKVKDEIAKAKLRIEEKKSKLASLQNSNSTNYLINEGLKETIEEKKIRLYALKKKCKNINDEIKEQEKVSNDLNWRFVSEEESLSSEEVESSLHNTLEIIEKLLSSNKGPKIQHNYPVESKTCFSTIKKNKYCAQTIKKFGSCSNLNSAKCLFVDNFKGNELNTENAKNLQGFGLLDKSGDLLPDSCFDFKADEEFLNTSQPSQIEKNFDDLFTANISEFDNSKNYPQFDTYQFKKTEKRDIIKLVSSNQTITGNIEKLYKNTNEMILWETLLSVRHDILSKIRVNVANEQLRVGSGREEEKEEDLVNLKFIFVRNNLLALKSKRHIKKLNIAIQEKKSDIEKRFDEDQMRILEKQFEQVKHDTAIRLMRDELKNFKKPDTSTGLNSLNSKINRGKQELFARFEEIEEYLELKKHLVQKMKEVQNDSFNCASKIAKLVCGPEWSSPLTEKLHLMEMNTFDNFPLNFNRKFYFTEKETYFRDLKRNTVVDDNVSSDDMFLISSIIPNPQYPSERIISDVFKDRNKLKILSALEFPKREVQKKSYSLKELKAQESYVDKSCEMMISQVKSMKSNIILGSATQMKTTFNLWKEMPFRHFISKEREVEGRKYEDYEKEIEVLKKNM